VLRTSYRSIRKSPAYQNRSIDNSTIETSDKPYPSSYIYNLAPLVLLLSLDRLLASLNWLLRTVPLSYSFTS